jgi:Skp family chaperone for outer membrane proteins
LACGVGAILAGLCPTVSLAQAPAAGAAPVQPVRVGFVNMQEVMKIYPRYKALQDELKKKDEEYLDQVKKKNQRLEALQKELQVTTDDKKKSAIEADMRSLRVDIETVVADAKKTLAKYFDEQVAEIYVQFYGAVAEVAKSSGFDIVWRYNEDWNKDDYSKPANIVRRAMANPVFPMYYDRDRYDITYRVANYMTQKYPAPAGATAGAATNSNVVPTGATTPAGGQNPR